MKKLLLLLILPLISILSSCDNSNGPTDPNDSILPLQIGNFWIYERSPVDSLGNVIGNPVFDTMSVISKKTYKGKIGYEIEFKRTGLYISRAILSSGGSNISYYGFPFNPLYSSFSQCNCYEFSYWLDLTRFNIHVNQKFDWKYSDSIARDPYPYLISYVDDIGNVIKQELIMIRTSLISNIETSFLSYSNIIFNKISRNGINYHYKGKTFLRMISPKNGQLTRPDNSKFTYYENDRLVKTDDINTYVTFAYSIGIVEVYEDYIYGLNQPRFKSKLIKYNLVE